MKKLCILFLTVAMMGIPNFQTDAQVPFFDFFKIKAKVYVKIKIARPKHDCEKGLWICYIQIVIGGEGESIHPSLGARESLGEIVRTDKEGKLLFRFLTPLPGEAEGESLAFMAEDEEAFLLPQEVSAALGLNRAKLIPGNYAINNTDDGNEEIWIDAEMEEN